MQAQVTHSVEDVTFKTRDRVEIFGEFHHPKGGDKSGPLILLFHQAGANARAEYGSMIPRLVSQGYHVLAIDQRSGGDRFGGVNRTAQAAGNRTFGYCDAYPDLDRTLTWVRNAGYSGKLAVWGSSYSAALVVRLAAERGDEIDAALAFSPAQGGGLADCTPAPQAVQTNLLALRPKSEMDDTQTAAQLQAFRRAGHQTYVANPGVHGSSMLNPARAGGDVEATWEVVLQFLRKHLIG